MLYIVFKAFKNECLFIQDIWLVLKKIYYIRLRK